MNSPPNREVTLFSAALELPASQRAAYLDGACTDDPALRQRVEALLRVHDEAIPFLENSQPESPDHAVAGTASNETMSVSCSPSEKPGDRIGRYKLLQQIGEGGCGVVYMAEQDEPVRRRVALKVIKLGMDTKQVIARFEAERQALALMDHPNIAKVLDAGATETGRPYFVMELVRGVKITDYCDSNNLSTSERLHLFVEVCHAVQHAHQKGIIHRDIKPSNILVTVSEPGAPACSKVIDFGIAKATTGQQLTDKTVFTAFEQFIGTPAYMSPEQAMMTTLDIDTRTDIYSLGVLLYELLTGKTPLDQKELLAAGLEEMRRTIREREPARPSTRLSTMLEAELTTTAEHRQTDAPKLLHLLRGDLDWIVMKCLEKERARRYETANGLAHDIERHLTNEPVVACPPTNFYKFQKLVRRNKLGFAAGTGIVAALVVGLAIALWQSIEKTRAYNRTVVAEHEAVVARARAETKEKKSEQVAQFLKDMLQGVGPSKALGRDTEMLKEILDKTVKRIAKDLTNQPEVEIEVRLILAQTYDDLELYPQMDAMARRSLELARSRPGGENADVASSLGSLGDAMMHLGKLDEAEKLLGESLALRKKLFGSENYNVAVLLNNLGMVLQREGKLAEAETVHRKALAMYRKLRGPEHLNAASSLGNLATVLAEQGNLAEAEAMQRDALAMERKILGDHEHPEIANSLGDLSAMLQAQGKLAEAETFRRDEIAMIRKLRGNEHPAVVASLNRLGTLLLEQGKLPEAETTYQEALATRRKLLGNEHMDVAASLDYLAKVFFEERKGPEVEATYREALAIRRKLLGDEHADVVNSINNLALVFLVQDKLPEAETLYREALATRRKVLGDDHQDVADSLYTLGLVFATQGRLAEAEARFRESISVLRKASAKETVQESPTLGMALHHLADVLRQQNAFPEARARAEEAAALYERHADWPAHEREHASQVLQQVLADLHDSDGLKRK